jgi:hypothetical protein
MEVDERSDQVDEQVEEIVDKVRVLHDRTELAYYDSAGNRVKAPKASRRLSNERETLLSSLSDLQ